MNTYKIIGNLNVRGIGGRDGGPFHLGAPDELSAYVDRAVFRDSMGRPLLPSTSLCGVMASLARASLRAAGEATPEKHPAFVALFGTARGDGEGQASRLAVRDSPLAETAASNSLVRDRNAINRERGSAEEKALFHEEVVDGVWSFHLDIEFTETGPRTAKESRLKASGSDPDVLAYRLLLDVLCLLEAGWANIGGNSGIGYGRFRLDDCRITMRNRCSPEEILAYAMAHWDIKDTHCNPIFLHRSLQDALPGTTAIAISENRTDCLSERIRFRCVLRPIEPLLVKSGYTTENYSNMGSQKRVREKLKLNWPEKEEEFAVDAGFCLDTQGKPYMPGSSVRGALRSHLERVVRTIVGDLAAWNPRQAQKRGQEFSEREGDGEDDVECLVSRVFGFSALGGRILFSDASPLDANRFESRRKLLDHVALDRFTGGAAEQRKFNSRPYFPPSPPPVVGSDGDLQCEIELYDFEAWHLGMLLLLLRDLRMGRVTLGHGKNKGFGRVRLESVEVEALIAAGGILAVLLSDDYPSLGGFKTFNCSLSFNSAGYLYHEQNGSLTKVFRDAEQSMRQQMANWTPIKERGGTS
ncbi:RAMP superfamily CRISPR-associated protein [Dehalococcoidia bacterium]|nr:RAMP superfamily CRISPR-associated protein [Dehalococcoidia bacterium]